MAVASPHQAGRARANVLAGNNISALSVKSGNTKMIYQDILTAHANATDDLSMPCY